MRKFLLIFFTILLSCNISAQFKSKDFKHIMKSNSIYEIEAFLKDAHKDDPRRGTLKKKLLKMIREYIKEAHPADPRVKELQHKITLLESKGTTKITFEEMTKEIKRKKIAEYLAKLQAKQKLDLSAKVMTGKEDVEVEDKSNKIYGGTKQRDIFSRRASSASSVGMSDEETEAEFNLLMNAEEKNDGETVQLLNKLFENDESTKETIVVIKNNSDCNIVVKIEGTNGLQYKLPIPAKSENSKVINKGDYIFSSRVCGFMYSSQKTVNKSLMISLDTPSS